MSSRLFAAVDIGGSGGRVVAGRLAIGRVSLDLVHRFPNAATERDGGLRWDIRELEHQIDVGLAMVPAPESIGIATFGVDYGLLGDDGELLADPYCYRDKRTTTVINEVHRKVPLDELFAVNGLQFLPFNSCYQLAADQLGPDWGRAAHAVLLPDLIAYRLTGELRTETTNASTTGLLDARTHRWSDDLLDRLAIPRRLLPELQSAGEVRGFMSAGIPVTTVASHDTASAVVAVPAVGEHFGYVACGTWSLVGLELDAPVLTPEAREANFSNELGVDGRTRFLRNVGGLWLLEECLRHWRRDDLAALLAAAAARPTDARIDVDDIGFIIPGNMPQRIASSAGVNTMAPPETVRCILESLADAYARTLRQGAELSGSAIDVVHIVGGGSQNDLLCRLTAQATGLPVVAGPVEATALGNILVQARANTAALTSLEDLRSVVAQSVQLRRYEPS